MLVTNIYQAFKQGRALANGDIWRNRNAAGQTLAAFLMAAIAVASGFGYTFPIDSDTVTALAGGVAACVSCISVITHVVTSTNAGIKATNSDNL